LWKIRLFHALFDKMREKYTPPKARQRALSQGVFRYLILPIRPMERLPERKYDGRFFSVGRISLGK
jgi:hypothetical protein